MTQEWGYLSLLRDVLVTGEVKPSRPGIDTLSLFGRQLRFDLGLGFPLLTTKKIHFKSVLVELLWFLRGDTDTAFLKENSVRIWDEWADSNGNVGPMYGFAWRHYGGKPPSVRQPIPRCKEPATYLGVACGKGKENHSLGKTWEGMISRCYDKNNISYCFYGQRGVSVCDDWLVFSKFAEDVENIAGWEAKSEDWHNYALDKDVRGTGFLYSPDTCAWISNSDNTLARNTNVYTVRRVSDGEEFDFNNPAAFCRAMNIPDNNFSDLWTGRKNAKVRHGFSLVRVHPLGVGVDQIQRVIESIRLSPESRRLVINAWNPKTLDQVALPPCHFAFQFYVSTKRKLSCHVSQRSADLFLGVPFNIASYALLTHMVAQVTDLQVGELVLSFGDVHLYTNHLDQAREQLSRTPMPLPSIGLTPSITNIDNFTIDDVKLINYNPHPAIKAPVAV